MFLGGETTRRGSFEKRKMGEKATDFTNPDYADREKEVYSFLVLRRNNLTLLRYEIELMNSTLI